MDSMDIERQNLSGIGFNERLKSFEDLFFDTDIIPNSRYRLVENTEEANPGYCNGILNEYESEILRKALFSIDPENSFENLDLSVNSETVYKKDLLDSDSRGSVSKRLVFNIGGNSIRCVSGLSVPTEKEVQSLLFTVMGIVERRIRNTTLIEFKIV